MRLSRFSLGVVTLGLIGLTSCNVDTEKLAAKLADDLKKADQRILVGVGDDQPIIIAGGSMNFIAPLGWEIKPDPSMTALNYVDSASPATIRYVPKVEILKPNDATELPNIVIGQDITITINYDKKKGGGNDPEVVTVKIAGGKKISITSNATDPRTWKNNSARFWSHGKKHKSISTIDVNGDTVDCGNDGECAVVIHYCTVLAGCEYR
ncbi:MAG: hypothetical protein JWP63_2579 [Candidatus Solibacter sp.]|nr:hypothetical protein [Candidatus Solibacter sp.]